MKRLNCSFALIGALALGFSAVAYADTVPDGAVRFTVYTRDGFSKPIDVPVPKGSVLVITDIALTSPGCDLFDGPDQKTRVIVPSGGATVHVGLQSGLEISTELRSEGSCFNMTVSGYWLNPS